MSSLVNIDVRGYGKIYKRVMRYPGLPLIAKAIYAYFCAYAGSSSKAFPRRDKITADLQINKDTFTKHLALLVDEGYISKERTAAGNLYTIMQTVPSYDTNYNLPSDIEEESDILVMENVQAHGFGTVPKLVMLDPHLSAQAKAIYAYFASFAGAGTTAFPRRATIMRELHMSEKTYYKHFKQLTDAHYITVEQRKSNGRFDVSLYRLADTVAPLPFPGAPNGKAPKKNPAIPSQKGMSEKVQTGGKLQNGTSGVTDNVMSQKVASDEIPQGKSSHANKKNSSITNISEKEQDHNQQAADETEAAVYSLEDAKHIIRYEFLLSEAAAWGELKELLNHYKTPEDKERYFRISPQIVLALAKQAANMLNVSRNPEAIIAQLQGEGLYDLFSELLDRWDAIQSIQSYVGRALANLVGTWDCGE